MINIEMTSLEIAEITGKAHKHVRRDISAKLLPVISESENGLSDFTVDTRVYKDSRGKNQDMYVLNKNSVNAFMANYSVQHAMSLVRHINLLEEKLEAKQKELDLMQSIVWEVINGQSWIGQNQALKMAGITHPVLFMRFLKDNPTFLSKVMNEGKLQERRVSKNADEVYWKFSQKGFKWLLHSKDTANTWVENQKALRVQKAKTF